MVNEELIKLSRHYFELAKECIDKNYLDDAIKLILESLRYVNSDIDFNEHYYTLSWLYNQKHEYEKAIPYLDLIDVSSRYFIEGKVLKNIIKLNKGDITVAKIELEKLYKINENNLNLISALSSIYIKLKMYKKAIEILRHGLILNSNSYDFISNIIKCFLETKDLESAIYYLNKFAVSYSNSVDYEVYLSKYYYLKKDFKNAKNHIKIAKSKDSNNDVLYYLNGLILFNESNFKEAIEEFKIAIKFDLDNSAYYFNVGKCYKEMKDYDSAIIYLKEAFEIEQNSKLYIKELIDVFEIINNKDMVKHYKDCLRLLKSTI